MADQIDAEARKTGFGAGSGTDFALAMLASVFSIPTTLRRSAPYAGHQP